MIKIDINIWEIWLIIEGVIIDLISFNNIALIKDPANKNNIDLNNEWIIIW